MSRTNLIIEQLLNDPEFDVKENGEIWTCKYSKRTDLSHKKGEWRQTGLSIKKTKSNPRGYYVVRYKNVLLRVHRIVYRKFHGRLEVDKLVDHIDGDSLNNLPSNLQQITTMENVQKGKKAKFTKEDILFIRNSPLTNKELADSIGCWPSVIGGIRRYERWGNT